MSKKDTLKVFLLSIVVSIVFLFIWNSYYYDTPIGFRPFRFNIHEVLRYGLYCNDFPACFRIGANVVHGVLWAVFSSLEMIFLDYEKFSFMFSASVMAGFIVIIVHCFLIAGNIGIQFLFLSFFFLNPLLYHNVGLVHHDISTMAFWALIFLFSEKILAFNLFYKLIIIALGSLFYENNGPILAFAFWAFSLRTRMHEVGLSSELFWIGFKSGILYLLPAIIAPAHVYIIASYTHPEGAYFFSAGSSFVTLWEEYGANNFILFTGFRLFEVLWLSVLSLFIILWVANKREVTEFKIILDYLGTARGSFLCFIIVGFLLTLGVGQMIAGIRYEWPRQFLPLTFMCYFLFSLIVSRELNDNRT